MSASYQSPQGRRDAEFTQRAEFFRASTLHTASSPRQHLHASAPSAVKPRVLGSILTLLPSLRLPLCLCVSAGECALLLAALPATAQELTAVLSKPSSRTIDLPGEFQP